MHKRLHLLITGRVQGVFFRSETQKTVNSYKVKPNFIKNMLKNNENLKYFIALNYFPKFGPIRIERLDKYFPDAKTAFTAKTSDFIQAGIEAKIANEFISIRKNIVPDKIITIFS